METQPKKIAIVHKDALLMSTLARFSQVLGYDVATLLVDPDTEPQKVASFVEEHQPDLVLLAENYQKSIPYELIAEGKRVEEFKKGEGLEALVEIRKTHPTTPIVMISGAPRHREDALAKGATGYLITPFGFSDYGSILKEYIR